MANKPIEKNKIADRSLVRIFFSLTMLNVPFENIELKRCSIPFGGSVFSNNVSGCCKGFLDCNEIYKLQILKQNASGKTCS